MVGHELRVDSLPDTQTDRLGLDGLSERITIRVRDREAMTGQGERLALGRTRVDQSQVDAVPLLDDERSAAG
jgi:hypothetical protein